jgi:hypothetical protein
MNSKIDAGDEAHTVETPGSARAQTAKKSRQNGNPAEKHVTGYLTNPEDGNKHTNGNRRKGQEL